MGNNNVKMEILGESTLKFVCKDNEGCWVIFHPDKRVPYYRHRYDCKYSNATGDRFTINVSYNEFRRIIQESLQIYQDEFCVNAFEMWYSDIEERTGLSKNVPWWRKVKAWMGNVCVVVSSLFYPNALQLLDYGRPTQRLRLTYS